METEKNDIFLFCLFTDITVLSESSNYRYYLNKFYGQILWFWIYNDTIANYIIKAEKEEEVFLPYDNKCSITVKRKNIFLEEDKFNEHAINSIYSYYGVHPDQEVVQVSKSCSSSLSGKLTVSTKGLLPYFDFNSTDWSAGLRGIIFHLQPQPAACFAYEKYLCAETQLLVPLPQLDETFYAFEKDDVLVGFRPCKPFGIDVNVRKEGRAYEITLTHILEESTDDPITLLRIQIIEPSHHCNIFRTKEEALKSLITL
jgi:hypothetical protein